MIREMTTEKAATEIRRAYQTYRTLPGTNEWMMIAEIVDRVDLTKDEITAAIRHLNRTDQRFHVIPESNQKSLTRKQRAAEVIIGNQRKHLIGWM